MFPAIPQGHPPPAYENPPEYAQGIPVDNQIIDSEIDSTVNRLPSPSLSEAEIAVFGIEALNSFVWPFLTYFRSPNYAGIDSHH